MAEPAPTKRFLTNRTNANVALKHAHVVPQNERRSSEVDLRLVPKYNREIYEYFLEKEQKCYCNRTYLSKQSVITERMRMILVDWIVDVAGSFDLHPETSFLAIDIVDRYLCERDIPRCKLQLVGITAVLIAAKHEEIWPPSIEDCVTVTADTYKCREVIEMERDIVTRLYFRFAVPTLHAFACFFIQASKCTAPVKSAVFLFLESAAHCYPMLSYFPSRVAAAATLLGKLLVAFNEVSRSDDGAMNVSLSSLWDVNALEFSQGISLDDIIPIAAELLPFTRRRCSSSTSLQALRRKYLSEKFHSVASLEFPPETILS